MGSSGTDKVFTGSIPTFYETYLVPLLFEPYAADLVNRRSLPEQVSLHGRSALQAPGTEEAMKTETVIDRLVQRLRQSGVDIKPLAESLWIEELESKLGCRFPVSFRSLVRRYRFLPFGLGPIELYANTGGDDEDELRRAVMRDPILSRITREGGYVHFARTSTGCYDPICFDTRAAGSVREYPVVRLDHEAMLCYGRLRVVEEIASSFLQIALENSNAEQPRAPERAT